jgi:hypothetical protein
LCLQEFRYGEDGALEIKGVVPTWAEGMVSQEQGAATTQWIKLILNCYHSSVCWASQPLLHSCCRIREEKDVGFLKSNADANSTHPAPRYSSVIVSDSLSRDLMQEPINEEEEEELIGLKRDRPSEGRHYRFMMWFVEYEKLEVGVRESYISHISCRSHTHLRGV